MIRTEEEIDCAVKKIVAKWFYTSPLLFKTMCKNPVEKNTSMKCETRSGKSRVEYNPRLLAQKSNAEIGKELSVEMSRILLGHCTNRRPNPFDAECAIKASNMAITQQTGNLPKGKSFEFYYKQLYEEKKEKAEQKKTNNLNQNLQNQSQNGNPQNSNQNSQNQNLNDNSQSQNGNRQNSNQNSQNQNLNDNSQSQNGNRQNSNQNSQNQNSNDNSQSQNRNSEFDDAVALWEKNQKSGKNQSQNRNRQNSNQNFQNQNQNDNSQNQDGNQQNLHNLQNQTGDKKSQIQNRQNGGQNSQNSQNQNFLSSWEDLMAFASFQQNQEEEEQQDKTKNDGSNLQTLTQTLENSEEEDARRQESEDATELWNDGDEMEELEKKSEMQSIVSSVEGQKFGILPGNIAGQLENTLKIKKTHVPDRIKIAKIFMKKINASATSGKQYLTRMRPNRRLGFLEMGKRRTETTKILCVLDVSNSVTDEWVSCYVNYLNFIKSKYKCEIDIVQADTKLKEETFQKMKKKIKTLNVTGRGGTDFQCVVDYLQKNKKECDSYSGVIIFTDGYVFKPKIPENLEIKILWAINKKSMYSKIYNEFHDKKNLLSYLDDN